MKPTDAAISELVRAVAAPSGVSLVVRRLFSAPVPVRSPPVDFRRVSEGLSALVGIGDWRVLPYLSPFLRYDEVQPQLFAAISALMPSRGAELAILDMRARAIPYKPPAWWPRERPFPSPDWPTGDHFARLLDAAHDDELVLGFLSFSADGHGRERAVRALSGHSSGLELPFLLLRMNDWVERIARLATAACLARIRSGYEASFARQLTLVSRLKRRHRWTHDGALELVERLLTESDSGRRALLYALRPSARDRRPAAELASRRLALTAPLPPEITALCAGTDPILRACGVGMLGRFGSDDELHRWIPRLARHPSAATRRRAFAVAEARLPALANELARGLVTDRNAWVREFARQRLGEKRAVDFASLYRDALSDERTREGALLGLMETGERADGERAVRYRNDPASRVRQAALAAAVALDPEGTGDLLLEALGSFDPGVSQAAVRCAKGRRVLLVIPDVEALIDSPHAHVRHHVLRVLRDRDPWAALVAALRTRHDQAPRVARFARVILSDWRRVPSSLWVEPSERQLQELTRLRSSLSDEPEVERTLQVFGLARARGG